MKRGIFIILILIVLLFIISGIQSCEPTVTIGDIRPNTCCILSSATKTDCISDISQNKCDSLYFSNVGSYTKELYETNLLSSCNDVLECSGNIVCESGGVFYDENSFCDGEILAICDQGKFRFQDCSKYKYGCGIVGYRCPTVEAKNTCQAPDERAVSTCNGQIQPENTCTVTNVKDCVPLFTPCSDDCKISSVNTYDCVPVSGCRECYIDSDCELNHFCNLNGKCVRKHSIVGMVSVSLNSNFPYEVFCPPYNKEFIYTFYEGGQYSVTNDPSDLDKILSGRYYDYSWDQAFGLGGGKWAPIVGIYSRPIESGPFAGMEKIITYHENGGVHGSDTEAISGFPVSSLAVDGGGGIDLPYYKPFEDMVGAVGLTGTYNSRFYENGTYIRSASCPTGYGSWIPCDVSGSYSISPGKGFDQIVGIVKFENRIYTYYDDSTYSISDISDFASFVGGDYNLASISSNNYYTPLDIDLYFINKDKEIWQKSMNLSNGVSCIDHTECNSGYCAPYIPQVSEIDPSVIKRDGICCPPGYLYYDKSGYGATCNPPSCSDGIKNNGEFNVDCEGFVGKPCPDCYLIDWRSQMTSVKDQGSCGSCWAYSVIGTIEANYKIKKGIGIDLSEQELISCSGAGSCAGGWPTYAFNYIKENGILTESCFPYMTQDFPCSPLCSNKYSINNYNVVSPCQNAIKTKLRLQGPLSVCLDWKDAIQFGTDGVGRCSGRIGTGGHCVVLVGYNDYGWLAKNSYGIGYMDNGYFYIGYGECRMEIGHGNILGIAKGVS